MLQIWGQVTDYAKFMLILLFVVLPGLTIFLTWIAKTGEMK